MTPATSSFGTRFGFVCALIVALAIAGPARADEDVPPRGDISEAFLVQEAWTGDFDEMLQRQRLRVLVVNSKTLYFVDRGRQRGAAYDAFKHFEDEVNKRRKKGRRFHVMFVPVSRDELVPKLLAGYGDVAAGNLTITPERQRLVDFTDPFVRGVDEVVVTGPESPPIREVGDLSGQRVFVRKSSSYYEHLSALNRALASEGKPPIVFEEAPEELEDEDLLEMVNGGLVPIVVVDDFIARFWNQVLPEMRVHEKVKVHSGGDIAWAIRKNSPKLKATLDDFVKRTRTGTAFGNELLRRYLRETKFVTDAVSDAEMRRFRDVIAFFRKYGGQYRLDPLLMAAQGYQESHLDQSKRNRSGAIGVMQVLPRTGKELGVGDIRLTEPNVHAGVKYIRFVIDEYWAGEPMDDLNRGLFAFASYNAGPARIRALRNVAAKRKLDPNVWFDNVEIVVQEKIGQETVQYVGNIYKYYIAYRLLENSGFAKSEAKRQIHELPR
jgi:membrane-bound lytic murein transglycosylase MltF